MVVHNCTDLDSATRLKIVQETSLVECVFIEPSEVADVRFRMYLASREIQTIQNHCLRACMGIWNPLEISRKDLHKLCDCKELCERRSRNLLSLVYTYSKRPDNIVVPTRVLRSNVKVKLKIAWPK